MAAVERGVEAGDLQHVGECGARGLDAGDVVRQVQRRQRHQCAQRGKHLVVDGARRAEARGAVNHAVADRGKLQLREFGVQQCEDRAECVAVAAQLACRQTAVVQDAAIRGARLEVSVLAQPVDLACRGPLQQPGGIDREQRELDRRGAGVEGDDVPVPPSRSVRPRPPHPRQHRQLGAEGVALVRQRIEEVRQPLRLDHRVDREPGRRARRPRRTRAACAHSGASASASRFMPRKPVVMVPIRPNSVTTVSRTTVLAWRRRLSASR